LLALLTVLCYTLTAVDETKAMVYTLNDIREPVSSLITVFGNPNDYVWKLGNLSAHLPNVPIHVRLRRTIVYDSYRAVAIDVQRTTVYYGNNVHGLIVYADSLNYTDATNHRYFYSPPTTKQVISLLFCY